MNARPPGKVVTARFPKRFAQLRNFSHAHCFNSGRIQSVGLGGAISEIFGSKVS